MGSPQLVLIGLDGLDWNIVDPLIAAGKMPNLAGLVARGAKARLLTINPILSPVVWTSIATGVKPERHGIVDFTAVNTETGEAVPVTTLVMVGLGAAFLLGRRRVLGSPPGSRR